MMRQLCSKLFSGRAGYFLGFIASFGLVGLALVIQTKYHLEPCPLWISQRMVFMGLGLIFLAAAIQKPMQLGRKVYALLLVLTPTGFFNRSIILGKSLFFFCKNET